jgi:hypothetical protein
MWWDSRSRSDRVISQLRPILAMSFLAGASEPVIRRKDQSLKRDASARNQNLSNGLLSAGRRTYRSPAFFLGESMHKISTAIVASTIFISPTFGHNREAMTMTAGSIFFHGARGPIASAGLPVLAVGYGLRAGI